MLTAVCQGDVTLLDLEEYLDAAVVAEHALSQAGRRCATMTMRSGRIRAYHRMAIVVVTEHTHGLARLFGALAAADRPIKIFRDARAARRWLEDQSA